MSLLRSCVAPLLLSAACFGAASAVPVGPPLERPAAPSTLAPQAWMLGAARAGQRLVAVGERGIVILSDDGGRQWRQARVPVSVTLTAVRFVDDRHGHAIGHGGVVLSTADGGEHWHKRLDGHQAAQLVLQEARARGAAAALSAADRLVADGADKPLLDLHFFDAMHGLVVGAYNLAFETRDGGRTWQSWSGRLPNPRGLHLYALRVRGSQVLIAGEQGLVLRSTDGGATFSALRIPYAGSFFTAELIGEQAIVVAGLRGNVWRSTNGGASWSKEPLPSAVTLIGSAVLEDGRMVLADQTGQVFAREPEQAAWQRVAKVPVPMLTGLADIGTGQLLLSTPAGVIPWSLPAGAPK